MRSAKEELKNLSPQAREILDDTANEIKFELGYPIVDVELEDEVILIMMKQVMRDLSEYRVVEVYETITNGTDVATVKGSSYTIDTTKLKHPLSYPVDVLTASGGYQGGGADIEVFEGIPVGMNVLGNYGAGSLVQTTSRIAQIYAERALAAQTLNGLKDTFTWDHDRSHDKLLLDVGYPSRNITLIYVPILSLSNIELLLKFPDAYLIMRELCKAQVFISLGRARGKYATSNYDWSISSAELIETGKEIKSEMMKMLRESYSYYITD